MIDTVNTQSPQAVEEAVCAVCMEMFPGGDCGFVRQAFGWAGRFFSGSYGDYQPIDALYHDFEHTLQGTLCLARILHGRHVARAQPPLSERAFRIGLLAILFHDTGYLKTKDDPEGTGAKYTLTHVNRSAKLAAAFLQQQGWPKRDTDAVQNMIHCTGVNVNLAAIPFQDGEERMVGFALGSADLIGQMAADDYVEKLPVLYEEFAEAAQFGGPGAAKAFPYTSVEDLLQKTPAFWEGHVRHRLDEDFGGLYQFMNNPWPDGPNAYIQRIERNIARLRS